MNIVSTMLAFSEQLIPLMLVGLVVALVMRYLAYRSGRNSQAYFNSFSRSVQKLLDEEQALKEHDDVEKWLNGMLERVVEFLPDRSLRFMPKKENSDPKESRPKGKLRRAESLQDYASGKRSVVMSVRQHIDAFKSSQPPDFQELTDRVLQQDSQWRKLLGFVPIDALSRIFDILPGMFVIGGIFGTFMGITSALPKIAQIDVQNLEGAGPILSAFVSDVAFSMNTSLVGIFCSVIVTTMIALFPLDTVRKQVMGNMEQAFEQIWYQIHGGNIGRGEKLMLSELTRLNQNIEKLLAGDKDQKNRKIKAS